MLVSPPEPDAIDIQTRIAARDEAQSAHTLEQRARLFARTHQLAAQTKNHFDFLKRLDHMQDLLDESYRCIREDSETSLSTSYAAEWMLDNYYIVQQSIRQIREDMPRGYYRQLPKIQSLILAGAPRIYVFVSIFLQSCQAQIDEDRLERFVMAFQDITTLTTGELWALPIMLRYGVLLCLTSAVANITGIEVPPKIQFFLDELPCGGDDDAVVSFSILSLRAISAIDWISFVERVNQVDKVLGQEPARMYDAMDFETRDRYRGVVERLSVRTGHTEEFIAQEAIRLSQEDIPVRESGSTAGTQGGSPLLEMAAPSEIPREAHVGYYLIDQGRSQLEDTIGYTPPLSQQLSCIMLRYPTAIYLGSIGVLSVLMLGFAVWYAQQTSDGFVDIILLIILGLVPVLSIAIGLSNWIFTQLIPPNVLPKMDFDVGIPSDCKTIVVVPCLLIDADEVESLLRSLELHYLGNRDPSLHFALLSDYLDASEEHIDGDKALLKRAADGVRALNRRYPNQPFLLLHRPRKWNPGEECWMGWERKRGKLIELNHLILERSDGFNHKVGDLESLKGIRYVITLDADTSLPRGSANKMIAALAHPLNQAEFGPDGQICTGYSILQPRVQIRPEVVNQTRLTQLSAGESGLDPYTHAVSDIYQDFFGEGIYVGKGIYDVAAFERSLDNRVPENALLSHDLFEGVHGRVGLVTDISLMEGYPSNYIVNVQRKHRWVRGDWQIAPWLLPNVPHESGGKRKNDLSVIDKWKILDNLRRSLFPLSLLLWFTFGWLIFPGSPLLWTAFGLLALGVPVVTSILCQTTNRRKDKLNRTTGSIGLSFGRVMLTLITLPYEALLLTDAILTTLQRMSIAHKRLLQWRTTAHTIRLFGKQQKISLVWAQMTTAVYISSSLVVLVILVKPAVLPVALPFLMIWLLSPWFAQWISQPLVDQKHHLSADQLQGLRRLACRTWMFFEHYVTPEGNWLPPDHFQENPRGIVVNHTSPTNIGLSLLSTLAAHDMGYIGTLSLELRLSFTLETMKNLERYQGHFLNWYEIDTLRTLQPRYVSTVDSGNLAGCLLTIVQGIDEVRQYPLMRRAYWLGFLDTMGVLSECITHLGIEDETDALQEHLIRMKEIVLARLNSPDEWYPLLQHLRGQEGKELGQLLISFVEKSSSQLEALKLTHLRSTTERVLYHLDHIQQELGVLAPWVELHQRPPEFFQQQTEDALVALTWQGLQDVLQLETPLDQIPEMCKKAQTQLSVLLSQVEGLQSLGPSVDPSNAQISQAIEWCNELDRHLETSKLNIHALLIGYQETRDLAVRFFGEMDFCFLFHAHRQVFHIGYNLDLEKLDDNFYDLLASEARLASYIAIAKGDVLQTHWLHLARPITKIGRTPTLLSWAGTMFEYLMPHLLMESNAGTLLDRSCRLAVQRQIDYGSRKNTPWGISESGFYHFDNQQNYQYKAFGTPGLGFKRGLEDDLVIAPYASMLALTIEPDAVARNVANLRLHDAMGCYGFYESLDFTVTRLAVGEQYQVVRSYYAHHQGMIFAALANFFLEGVMVRRFHSNPLIQSVDLLLYEHLPRDVPIQSPHPDIAPVTRPLREPPELWPWQPLLDAPAPQVHVLSNGCFSTLITHNGGGYCALNGKMLTRWRSDPTLDDWGTWIYIQDEQRRNLWGATHHPVGAPPSNYQVTFHHSKAFFQRSDHDITTQLQVAVHPGDDLEVRHLTLSNHSGTTRELTVTSYGEVSLAPHEADRRHPAFNKLFVENEFLSDERTILYGRRSRSSDEDLIFLAHSLVLPPGSSGDVRCVCSRGAFLGRNGDPRSPHSLRIATKGTTATDLDPIFSLSLTLTIPPHQSREVAFITAGAVTREDVLALTRKYQIWARALHCFDQASSLSEQVLSNLEMSTAELAQAQKMLSLLFYPHRALRASAVLLAANTLGQPGLWKFAISGDYPILLASIGSEEEINLVAQLLKCHAYWRSYNLKIDLVFLNLSDTSYDQSLHNLIFRVLDKAGVDIWLNRRGGIFMLRDDQLSTEERILLMTVARVVLRGNRGSLSRQLAALFEPNKVLPQFVVTTPIQKPVTTPALTRPKGLLFDNGLGGFSPNSTPRLTGGRSGGDGIPQRSGGDGKEYVIYLQAGQSPPAPWINVIANPDFGFVVSDAGLGYTWAGNSGENRLTPWRNDPVIDLPGEALYLRDEESGHVWSPTPLPVRSIEPYLIRHGAGYSTFEHNSHGIRQHLCVFAVKDAPVKVMRLKLENTLSRTRRISVTYYAEWVLGSDREITQATIVPEFDARNAALLARNAYSTEFSKSVAFLASTREPTGLTTDRAEFLGIAGNMRDPAALRRVGLTGNVEVGADPCAVLQTLLWIAPGETKEVTFILGQGADRDQASSLLSKYRDIDVIEQSWDELNEFWDDLLGRVTVQTPDPALDIMLNRWLLYQALSCRIWGRSALYQSSGAFGFRDQLQDVMSLIDIEPAITRDHILESASHQFEAGDVLHWWHPPSGRGVRTRCSDDLLWLPYFTAQYIQRTGDLSILQEKIRFLEGELLGDEHERYAHYQPGTTEEAILEHCHRALEKGTTRGAHGLPLIGSHDWNDGLNRVGLEGKGESVWNGWFLHESLMLFADLCDRLDDRERAAHYRQQAEQYVEAIEEHAWDGEWYLRAFYDDGTPLGSAQMLEGQIDSLPQSWGVLTGAAQPERARQAMDAVYQRLVRPDDQMVLLFTPPFDQTARDPGYIKGYPPGIRENGGQYTHAAIWAVWAFAKLGDGDRVGELFKMLNPIYHGDSPEKARCYRVEPYVVAADVYSVVPYTGRGGWTWYTGSAGWMYRLGVEAILGLQRMGESLKISPCIPKDWPGFEITYRLGKTKYHIQVENPAGVNRGVRQLIVNGKQVPGDTIPLRDDRKHHQIIVILGTVITA